MLTIPITLGKTYFLTNFRIFHKGFFAKNGKNLTFSGLNARGLEFKPRAQQGMTFLIPTFICIVPTKTLIF